MHGKNGFYDVYNFGSRPFGCVSVTCSWPLFSVPVCDGNNTVAERPEKGLHSSLCVCVCAVAAHSLGASMLDNLCVTKESKRLCKPTNKEIIIIVE